MNLLPGTFPALSIAPPIESLVLAASAIGADGSASLTVPASVRAGDLMLFLDRSSSDAIPALVTPSGFANLTNTTLNTNLRMALSAKIASGTEGGTMLTGMAPGTFEDEKILAVFRSPGVPIGRFVAGDGDGGSSSADPPPQVVNASAVPGPLLVVGCYGANSPVDPRTFSPAKDAEIGAASGRLYLAWRFYPTGPQDTTVDMADENDGNVLQSLYFRLFR